MRGRPLDEPTADWIGGAYDRHGAGLYRYALMLLGDTASAADAVQQVFATLAGRARGAVSVDDEARYLRRAVRNQCFSALRRRRREQAAMAGAPPIIEPIDRASGSPELRAAIEEALRKLPADQREVVHLKVFEGLTFQEIADVAGESINTIASRYRYAMDKLRTCLRRIE
jgi:RNA polymerase sigma-70 factor, ECF subfamily